MEHTFMTIHNLTPTCNILFASESINEILGWRAEDVRGRSVFDYFHPDEVPFARSIHSRGILLDKAASLHYARILSADGRWVSCECCFTVVHDVLVACTSIYRQGEKSERRALEGAQIRRLFSSSPRDPRYHMLEHLSPKFQTPPVEREPRAALILNRFTRNLTIMFATNAVASVLGLPPDQVKDKAFYRCIQERCLPEALRCLESAKANDSIAYLRFWSRDPRDEDFNLGDEDDEDRPMDEDNPGSSPSDSDNGGAPLSGHMDVDRNSPEIKREEEDTDTSILSSVSAGSSGQGSIAVGSTSRATARPAYETPVTQQSPASAVVERQAMRPPQPPPHRRRPARQALPSVELEAVVSCTSDGLVVILRRARPAIPPAHPPLVLPAFEFENGLFAAPWAQQPVRPYVPPEMLYTFRAPLLPQYMPLRENVKAAGGPPIDHLMRSIRDVAVFAWALVGINGNFAAFSQGRPLGEAAPPDGLPIWDPYAANAPHQPPENQAYARWVAYDEDMDKGKSPAVPQSRPDPYFAHYHGPVGSRHDPGPHYDRHNYGMRDVSTYSGQQQPHQPVSNGYIPPHHQDQQQQQQQQHGGYPGSTPHPWQDRRLLGRLPVSVPDAFNDTPSQPPDRPDSSPPQYDPRWLGGPYRG